jgi:eukaryotic-like serine/threonine-protein kinase
MDRAATLALLLATAVTLTACGGAPPPPATVPVAPPPPVTVLVASSPTATPAPPQPALAAGSTQVSPKDGMVQVYVPAGEFLMGSADSDADALSSEKPQHKVYLDAYWIDQTEVTNAMVAKCIKEGGGCVLPYFSNSKTRASYYSDPQYANYPVIFLNWGAAQSYCTWAGRRLPTEAEWEKAARGTDGRKYPWGNDWDAAKLNSSEKGPGDTSAVGSYPAGASPYGALDMAGNVWEWVADWYLMSENYYTTSPSRNPTGPPSGGDGGDNRVIRGGSWHDTPVGARTAGRNYIGSTYVVNNIGFRCSRSP